MLRLPLLEGEKILHLARPAGLEPATPGLAYQLLLSQPPQAEFVVWTISSPSQVPHV